MKQIPEIIKEYLFERISLECCDLYELRLLSGEVFRFADYDDDVVSDGAVYDHNLFRIKREQISLNGEPNVDSLSLTIYCESGDRIAGVPFMRACHDGTLDQAMLSLKKAFFDDGRLIGSIRLFSGRTEVNSSGGIAVKLTAKSVLQGLAAPIPVRMFAAQSAYANSNGVVTTSSTDLTSMLIPLKPSMNVLIKV